MQTEKISISLPSPLVQFVENYKITKGCKSRSQVIELALDLLRYQDLEQAYREASTEIDEDWELTAGEGLTDETW
ncbi:MULTISPECIES: CopG family transcriptional regulator [Nostocaceae]|jgi:antitoxin ParD1/3/4|uniref:CopG family transcriptional regulator n=1 Tax=Anabaena catenula FACHB-362 TaxID=2692877 RepID=A0ABR8J9C3_9NOST|nr:MULTISPECIES: CopG family transcriptional regulator [Nostocaceae]MBD2693736.1 CopG family transcriptional regulator [Anabaena catenula FACHB-362]